MSSRRGETNVFLERGLVTLVLENEKADERMVSVETDGSESPAPMANDGVVMKPGDHVSFSATTQVLRKDANEKYKNVLTWKNGTCRSEKWNLEKYSLNLKICTVSSL